MAVAGLPLDTPSLQFYCPENSKQSNEHVKYFQVFRVPETATVLLR